MNKVLFNETIDTAFRFSIRGCDSQSFTITHAPRPWPSPCKFPAENHALASSELPYPSVSEEPVARLRRAVRRPLQSARVMSALTFFFKPRRGGRSRARYNLFFERGPGGV